MYKWEVCYVSHVHCIVGHKVEPERVIPPILPFKVLIIWVGSCTVSTGSTVETFYLTITLLNVFLN